MREVQFSEKEFYHVYNRGVDKKNVFVETKDIDRFFRGIEQFNTRKILGSLARGHRVSTDPKLVNIVAYCINPNHFHLILEQVSKNGIEKFMHKLSMGYAKYFNTKYKRSGALFQGKFKAIHIDSNEYLLYLSAYINLNDVAHARGRRVSLLSKSSWDEYVNKNCSRKFCKKDIILEQFDAKHTYKKFAEEALRSIVERKHLLKELELGDLSWLWTPSVHKGKK